MNFSPIPTIFWTEKGLTLNFLFIESKVPFISACSLSILLIELVDKVYSIRDQLEIDYLSHIFDKLSDLENRVAQSTFGDIYYSALIGIFKSNNKN